MGEVDQYIDVRHDSVRIDRYEFVEPLHVETNTK